MSSSSSSALRLAARGMRQKLHRRSLHSSSSAQAISKFTMPAMSPTMTEGGLASWKVKDGDKFSAGDVLLEIETDKATMDVEAQDDGVMAKILVNDGAKAVPVGKIIAMLAEEGDDISNVEVPKEEGGEASQKSSEEKESSSSSTPPPKPESKKGGDEEPLGASEPVETKHAPKLSKPVMPSVMRLLADFNVSSSDADSIEGTGVRGRLTKGDVLTFLGKAQGPTGTYKEDKRGISGQAGAAAPVKKAAGGEKAPAKSEPLTADALRSMILSGLASSSHSSRAKEVAAASVSYSARSHRSAFDELLDDYEFKQTSTLAPAAGSSPSKDPFKGLL